MLKTIVFVLYSPKKLKKMARTRAVLRQRPNVNPQQRPNVVKIKFLLKNEGSKKHDGKKKKKRKIWIKTNGRCCIKIWWDGPCLSK